MGLRRILRDAHISHLTCMRPETHLKLIITFLSNNLCSLPYYFSISKCLGQTNKCYLVLNTFVSYLIIRDYLHTRKVQGTPTQATSHNKPQLTTHIFRRWCCQGYPEGRTMTVMKEVAWVWMLPSHRVVGGAS
jgi:hypothetical protein